jgi:hypothetical protein
MDTPRFLHCFSTKVVPNPALKTTMGKIAVEYRTADRRVPVGGSTTVKFKLTDTATAEPAGDIPDVTVLYYRSDGRGRMVVPARSLGEGLYEATVKVDFPATYYVFVGSKSKNLSYSDLPFLSLMGTPAPAGEKEVKPQSKAGDGA